MAMAYPQALAPQRTLFQSQIGYLNALHSVWTNAVTLQNYTLSGGLMGPLSTGSDAITLNLPNASAGSPEQGRPRGLNRELSRCCLHTPGDARTESVRSSMRGHASTATFLAKEIARLKLCSLDKDRKRLCCCSFHRCLPAFPLLEPTGGIHRVKWELCACLIPLFVQLVQRHDY